MKILLINGVNLNMTGMRETALYGTETLETIERELQDYAKSKCCNLTCFQSNIEGEIVNALHSAMGNYDALIINAGAYSHYSYAICDAITASKLPAIEVHISNVFKREEYRQKSVLAPVCVGYISGLGKYGYMAALDYFISNIK